MLLQIAWRNVWRSKLRSLVVMLAISLGLLSGVFMMAFSWGFSAQRMRSAIETEFSHVQVHDPVWKEDRRVADTLANASQMLARLQADPSVKAASGRTLTEGMITTARGASGVMVHGVDPAEEMALTRLNTRVKEGQYLDTAKGQPVLIGAKLAEKYKLRLRNTIVLTFQDVNGEVTTGAFKVAGIFETVNTKYDEANVFVKKSDLQALIGIPGQVHEIAFLMHEVDSVPGSATTLATAYPDALVEDWKTLSPELRMVTEQFGTTVRVFVGIILMALAFSIINTMLMAVLERTRELGMLMAVGMNKWKVFVMIMTETVFLTLVGAPFGMLMGWLLIVWTGKTGIDLSNFSGGLNNFGYDPIIYPELSANYYLEIMIMVVITALLSAIYPAIKALRLKPVEAIRAI